MRLKLPYVLFVAAVVIVALAFVGTCTDITSLAFALARIPILFLKLTMRDLINVEKGIGARAKQAATLIQRLLLLSDRPLPQQTDLLQVIFQALHGIRKLFMQLMSIDKPPKCVKLNG